MSCNKILKREHCSKPGILGRAEAVSTDLQLVTGACRLYLGLPNFSWMSAESLSWTVYSMPPDIYPILDLWVPGVKEGRWKEKPYSVFTSEEWTLNETIYLEITHCPTTIVEKHLTLVGFFNENMATARQKLCIPLA